MAFFSFYPYRLDGASLAFETYELADDAAALRWAAHVLSEHRSAERVVVWEGEREVGAVVRETSPA